MNTRRGFREYVEKQAVRILHADLSRCGGLAEGKKIADMADVYHMSMAPHNVCSPLGTVAVAHSCAAMPNFLAMEIHHLGVPWWDDLAKRKEPLIGDGYVQIPDKPGIGLELDEKQVRKHLKEGESYF